MWLPAFNHVVKAQWRIHGNMLAVPNDLGRGTFTNYHLNVEKRIFATIVKTKPANLFAKRISISPTTIDGIAKTPPFER